MRIPNGLKWVVALVCLVLAAPSWVWAEHEHAFPAQATDEVVLTAASPVLSFARTVDSDATSREHARHAAPSASDAGAFARIDAEGRAERAPVLVPPGWSPWRLRGLQAEGRSRAACSLASVLDAGGAMFATCLLPPTRPADEITEFVRATNQRLARSARFLVGVMLEDLAPTGVRAAFLF